MTPEMNSMNNTTKQKLGRALYTLLQEKQLNEINVADITALCGLSRKTFYYYYQDVYSLVYGFIEDTFDRIASEEGYRFWPIFERLVSLVKENSEVVQNVYNSVDRELLYNFLHRTLSRYSVKIIRSEIGDGPYPEEDLALAGNMCLTAIQSVFLQWIHFHLISDMEVEFTRHRDKLQGFSRVLLEHMRRNDTTGEPPEN
jgi:AcrR family transcriptional regulator